MGGEWKVRVCFWRGENAARGAMYGTPSSAAGARPLLVRPRRPLLVRPRRARGATQAQRQLARRGYAVRRRSSSAAEAPAHRQLRDVHQAVGLGADVDERAKALHLGLWWVPGGGRGGPGSRPRGVAHPARRQLRLGRRCGRPQCAARLLLVSAVARPMGRRAACAGGVGRRRRAARAPRGAVGARPRASPRRRRTPGQAAARRIQRSHYAPGAADGRAAGRAQHRRPRPRPPPLRADGRP